MFDLLIKLFPSLQETMHSLGAPLVYLILFLVGSAACLVLPWFRIFRRAGLSPGLGLFMFIPIVNIVVFLIFAYREWPIERENRTPEESAFSRM